MKYERLTVRLDDGRAYIKDDGLSGLLNMLYRLAEIEDMIERGELVKVPKGAVVLTPEERKQAVKEFAERVKMAFYYEFDELIPSIMADKIDELAREVSGE